MRLLPSFSIVTPSFNQRAYVERSLESVIRQKHKPVEHFVLDPGSTDGTREVLVAYANSNPFVRLIFENDDGQADAINNGFIRCTGDIVTWLNTDDCYIDGEVLSSVARIFADQPEVDFVYGRGSFVNKAGQRLRSAFINSDPDQLEDRLLNSVGILQPASFYRRTALQRVGRLDKDLECAFDYDLWVRFAKLGSKFYFIDRELALATFHENAKSSLLRSRQLRESIDVTARYYGFGSAEWIKRAAECDVLSQNGIIDENTAISSAASQLIGKLERILFRCTNGNKRAKAAILSAPHASPYNRTQKLANCSGLMNQAQVIVTAFDKHYAEQGLTLISSIHRYQSEDQVVLVYDLNLPSDWVARLEKLHNVFVIPFPSEDVASFPDFLEPKNYGYKCSAIWDARRYASEGGSILWIDAGIALLQPLDKIFELIEKEEVFFVDHDDKPNWPFFNATFTHPVALERMQATRDEMFAPHLRSCLVGYKTTGKFTDLFRIASSWACDRDKVVWDKHPILGTKIYDQFSAAGPSPKLLAEWKADGAAYKRADLEVVREGFGYLGHRQDQSIFSVLAARYKAPIHSASIYCRSDDYSSTVSKLNWVSGAVARDVSVAEKVPEQMQGAVTYHHRGTFHRVQDLVLEKETSRTLVILGNGPSLRGFNFERLRGYDTVGMNAAYRYWHEIGWYPRFYICLDKVVGLSHKRPIEDLIRKSDEYGIEVFILRENLIDVLADNVKDNQKILSFDAIKQQSELFDPMPITTGSHAALLGALLGYKRMVLLGIDCNYVEEVPGSVLEGGTKLRLAETPEENPNYFFEGYQVAGDEYNVPNPTPDLHIDSWRAVAPVLRRRNIDVWNGSSISRVDVFPYRDFEDIEQEDKAASCAKTALSPSSGFSRDARKHVDETGVIAKLLAGRQGSHYVMLDVGAHFGTSAEHFQTLGWSIYCLEPDEGNRKKLEARFGCAPNVMIDPRAVSDHPAGDVPFFSSPESSGVSGLHAFLDTHRETARVNVTTVAEIVEAQGFEHIDFLKIDVEGLDWNVLKGVPWHRIKPSVIECEFEDAKTVPLGHNYVDIADYLVERGYTVYLSEWHPITRYGVRHDWRRVVRYPASDVDAKAWGNLLAFQNDPGLEKILSAFHSWLTEDRPGARTTKQGQRTLSSAVGLRALARYLSRPSLGRLANLTSAGGQFLDRVIQAAYPFASHLALWAHARSPVLYSVGRFAKWCLGMVRRYPKWAVAYVVLIGGLFGLGLMAKDVTFGPIFWIAAIVVGLCGAAALPAAYASSLLTTYKREALAHHTSHSGEIAHLRQRARTLETQLATIEQTLQTLQTLQTQLATIEQTLQTLQTLQTRLTDVEKAAAKRSEVLQLRQWDQIRRRLRMRFEQAQPESEAARWRLLIAACRPGLAQEGHWIGNVESLIGARVRDIDRAAPTLMLHHEFSYQFTLHRSFGLDDYMVSDQDANLRARPELRKWASAETAGRDMRAIDGITYKGVPVGRLGLATARLEIRKSRPETEQDWCAVERYVAEAAAEVDAAAELLERVQPDVLLTNHSTYSDKGGPIFHLALQRGIPTFCWQCRGPAHLTMRRFALDCALVHVSDLPAALWELIRDPREASDRIAEIESWLERRRQGEGTMVPNAPQIGLRHQSESNFAEIIDLERPNVAVFTHLPWDASGSFYHDVFPSLADWVEFTADAAKSNTSVNWIFRIHPAEAHRGTEEDTEALIRRRLKGDEDNIKIIPSHRPLSSYALIPHLTAAVTVRGTLAVEAPCFGLPVICAGTGQTSGLAAVRNVTTVDEYAEALEAVEMIKPVKAEARREALLFAHAYFIQNVIELSCVRDLSKLTEMELVTPGRIKDDVGLAQITRMLKCAALETAANEQPD